MFVTFLQEFVRHTNRLTAGDPMAEATTVGATITTAHADKVWNIYSSSHIGTVISSYCELFLLLFIANVWVPSESQYLRSSVVEFFLTDKIPWKGARVHREGEEGRRQGGVRRREDQDGGRAGRGEFPLSLHPHQLQVRYRVQSMSFLIRVAADRRSQNGNPVWLKHSYKVDIRGHSNGIF